MGSEALNRIGPSSKPARHALHYITIFVAMLGEWIWLVAGAKLHEMLVGFGVVIVAGLFLRKVFSTQSLQMEFTWADLLSCWRLPWYVASDVWIIVRALFRELFLKERAESIFRVSQFDAVPHDPRSAARIVLATIYTTASPNFLVIGIDAKQMVMLFHQIERTDIPQMTRSLGAEP